MYTELLLVTALWKELYRAKLRYFLDGDIFMLTFILNLREKAMRHDPDYLPPWLNIDRKVAEIDEQIEKLQREKESLQGEKYDFSLLELRESKEQKRARELEEAAEIRWYRDQERQQIDDLLKKEPESPLLRARLHRLNEQGSRPTLDQGGSGALINWQWLFMLLTLILAWFWFNRPVEPRFESQSDRIQTTQTVRW